MNWKTTLILAIVVAAGAGAWYLLDLWRTTTPDSPTLTFLEKDLKPEKLTRIAVERGKRRVELTRKAGEEWALPGGWPIRDAELKQFLTTLTTLRSRHTPVAVSADKKLEAYGLTGDPLRLFINVDDKEHTLTFGEEPAHNNRFTRATWLRLDGASEVVRLGPGVIAALDRSQEFFQKPRLFAYRAVPEKKDALTKVDELDAKTITIKGPDGTYTLTRKRDAGDTLTDTLEAWELSEPVRDRLDQDKVKSILTGFTDLWAEKYIDRAQAEAPAYAGLLAALAADGPAAAAGFYPGWQLAPLGLDGSERTLTVHGPSGKVTLLIGGVSRTEMRFVMKPAQFPGAPPMKMPIGPVDFRYARLEGNDQIFEIKGEHLRDILVSANALRDPHLARFKPDDVRGLSVAHGKTELAFRKEKKDDKDHWRMLKPDAGDAEAREITDLVDKLANLQARDADIIDQDKAKPKTEYGLDEPAVLTLEIEEGKKEHDKEHKKTRQVTFRIGAKEAEKGKLYVQVDDWPRINVLEESDKGKAHALWKLVNRPALAYRPRKVLDIEIADIARIEVQRDKEAFALAHEKDKWRLVQPVSADVNTAAAADLAQALGRLDVVEFIAETPKKGDLDKVYGLEKASVTAKLDFADAKKPARFLRIGKESPDKKEHYFARVDEGPVFLIRKSTLETVQKDALAYRTLPLWDVPAERIAELNVKKGDSGFTLKRDGSAWKITEPFAAPAVDKEVRTMVSELSDPRREKYVAHQADDPKTYGLDPSALRLTLIADDKEAKHKSYTLEIGKPVEKDAKARYARLDGDKAIFTVSDKLAQGVDRTALDLLDRTLVKLDPKSIQQIRVAGGESFTLKHDKDAWQIVDSPAKPFAPDDDALQETLRAFANLRAERFAAYGPKVNWADFGLDKPAVTVTVNEGGKDHTLALGKEVADHPGERYARVDKQEGVAILAAPVVRDLKRTHLDFVDRRVLKFDLDAVNAIQRKMGKDELEIIKKDDVWNLVRPAAQAADTPTIENLLERTFRLRAKRVAAYPAKDLKPFGLDQPVAVVTLKLGGDTPAQHVVKIGKPALEPGQKETGERYAVVDDSMTVIVLDDDLAKQLVASALQFRDRNLASFSSADKVVLERGDRKAVFAKVDGMWRMTEPVKAGAEDADLDDFLRGLYRLRADEIVAEKPADKKAFGLDPPQLRWRFASGDKEILQLLVGTQKDARAYAQLAGGDLIFLLNPKVTSRALGEYRSRTIWPPLDAVQIEKLTFTYADKPPFTLQKEEKSWRVAGQFDAKVDDKAVTDALDALADLKAQRYAADQKGNLQLYGLAPMPALTIRIQTTAGERVLNIGRPEGESERRYGTVTGAEGAPVFVISENDARRIVRPLQQFLEPKTATE